MRPDGFSHKVFLQLISVNFLRFCSFKNIRVKANREHHSKSTQLKGYTPHTAQTFLGNSEKFPNLQRKRLWQSTILIKLQKGRYAVPLLNQAIPLMTSCNLSR